MVINFLYCIDFPSKADNLETSCKINGWLLCSEKIIDIDIPHDFFGNFSFNYRLSRPDVAEHFKEFPDNVLCGFSIISKKPIKLNDDFILKLKIITSNGKKEKLIIALKVNDSNIQEIEIDDAKEISDSIYNNAEKKYFETLQINPWLTVRMDITNKCNLKCIMCHYKEKEIYSQLTKTITADQLKHNLKDIGPYVKHIMLSCGFEPLMSKHFTKILCMLNDNFPHMEIALCTNGMLLDSKARKAIIENNVTNVLLSLDGVTKNTVEKIRVGAKFEKIISNILALRDLKIKYNKNSPMMFMDFVLMNSNIHEATAFIELCSTIGIEMIDFRHVVGNIYFSDHEEMLTKHPEKYNYYRKLIIEESKKFNIKIRLPEPFETNAEYIIKDIPDLSLTEFNKIAPDIQTEEVFATPDKNLNPSNDDVFEFLSNASCLRPFNEIMIVDQQKILPCSYYSGSMGTLDENNTLYSIFFNENFQKVRRKKILSRFDHNCLNCPIKSNLLPTKVEQ